MNQYTAKLLLAQRARIDAIPDSLERMRESIHFYNRVYALYFGGSVSGSVDDLLHLYAATESSAFATHRARERHIREYPPATRGAAKAFWERRHARALHEPEARFVTIAERRTQRRLDRSRTRRGYDNLAKLIA